MKQFMDENFLLESETARELFHEYAKEMPIYDYHCHLSPGEIAHNKSYKNITEVWLGGDHYKWRAMRSNGVEEKYITGDASDKEKFMKWAETIENCIGNPLYHWTHLELQRYFGIDTPLSSKTADAIWEQCNALLNDGNFTARQLIEKSLVKVICTTDDPTDTLEYHKIIRDDANFSTKVLPTFRPDKGINIEKDGFKAWIEKLAAVADVQINGLTDLLKAMEERIDYFHEIGCRLSDHALEPPTFCEGTDVEVDLILKKALNGSELTKKEVEKYKTKILTFCGKEYAKRGWAMQLHIGCQRNNNSRKFNILGPDTGFDTIGDQLIAEPLAKLLDVLEYDGQLPKTILYPLNPRDNEVIGSLIGCYQGEGVPGKIQFGSGWWFNDQKDGMIRQMTALANLGLLSRFVGMLTDSRSFLSYTRHEYFRRILCNLIGGWVDQGEFPKDMKLLGNMIRNISYNNALAYFNIKPE
ncbi:glucuronate isomerase [Vallitalea okinawensis]|uniref:glucuronate isomerase n=1 Tax=Vallitalea okinawensis TaxID=2078660 RepID=UPI000CFAB99D|nr:glucuronate isomerase [Vallitalea okinawensis]